MKQQYLQKAYQMSNWAHHNLKTNRSICMDLDYQLNSRKKHTHDSIFYQKIDAHLKFMEKQFKRNIEWQRQLLCEYKQEKKGETQHHHRNYQSIASLRLSSHEERILKQILKDHCQINHDYLELQELISLATESKKNAFRQRNMNIDDQILPRKHFAELNHFPATHKEEKINIPKYKKMSKNPNHFFTPDQQDIIDKQNVKPNIYIEEFKFPQPYPSKPQRLTMIQDSIEKRLNQKNIQNITFQVKNAESRSIKNDNTSLSFSSSFPEESLQNARVKNQESVILLSDNSNHSNPSIVMKLKASKSQQDNVFKEIKNQKQASPIYLCFNQNIKRKIAHKKQKWTKRSNMPSLDEPKIRKLHDSFGNIYHEFEVQKCGDLRKADR